MHQLQLIKRQWDEHKISHQSHRHNQIHIEQLIYSQELLQAQLEKKEEELVQYKKIMEENVQGMC